MKINHWVAGLALCLFLLVTAWFASNQWWQEHLPDELAEWHRYKCMFITREGRVLDTGNQGVSHSEGQGWGMLLAVENGDRKTFDRAWEWTRNHLQIREDRLFAWRWLPDKPDNPTPDKNNASDGDVYIAWSLLRAGNQWGEAAYTDEARAIMADIRQRLVRRYGGETVLLPGREGFERQGHLLLNLSYWIFPAFEEFGQVDPDPVWQELRRSGIHLIAKARFGQWQLPPDWAVLKPDGELAVATDFPPRFGFDAIRVPLAMYWGGVDDAHLFAPYRNLIDHFNEGHERPAWVNLEDNSVATYAASAGMKGIMDIARLVSLGDNTPPSLPQITPDQDYFGASLVMLTRQAVTEVGRR